MCTICIIQMEEVHVPIHNSDPFVNCSNTSAGCVSTQSAHAQQNATLVVSGVCLNHYAFCRIMMVYSSFHLPQHAAKRCRSLGEKNQTKHVRM